VARRLPASLALCLALALAAAALAQDDGAPAGVVMQADSLTYAEVHGVVTARGNVEMGYEGRILQADTVSYNEPADLVIASGNVILVEPTGEVMFAEYAELTGDMREGAIESIRVLLQQNARFAANGARRYEGRITQMSKAVYSSCDLCPDDPDAAPLWQVKAREVTHDQQAHDIIYRDATLEVYGVPVAYTPYFRHADPTVERRSGFLTPILGSTSTLGLTSEVPYYFVLAPNRDATFAPIFTTDEGVVLTGQYRARTTTGIYDLNGSITHSDPRDPLGGETGDKKLRYHIKGDGLWRPDDTWQYGFNVYRASDDNYLGYYDFDRADTLTSDLFL